MSNPEWGGQGVNQNTMTRTRYKKGVKIGCNEVAVNIMWYDKIGIGSDNLDYCVWRTFTSPIVQSYKYFIPFGFNMHRILGRTNPVPRMRRSTRSNGGGNTYDTPQSDNQTSDEAWRNKEFGL